LIERCWVCSKRQNYKPEADAVLVVLSTEGVVEETIAASETVYRGRGESRVR
jgi:hypothetical protein